MDLFGDFKAPDILHIDSIARQGVAHTGQVPPPVLTPSYARANTAADSSIGPQSQALSGSTVPAQQYRSQRKWESNAMFHSQS